MVGVNSQGKFLSEICSRNWENYWQKLVLMSSPIYIIKSQLYFKMKKFTPDDFLSMSFLSLIIEQHAVSRFLLISIFIRVIKFSRIGKYVYLINYASIMLKTRVLLVITLVFLFLVRCRFPSQFFINTILW